MASQTPPGSVLDALAVLERDHRLIERLFSDFDHSAPMQLDPIGRRICKLLRIHTQIEEEIFYPAARAALADPSLIDRAQQEHAAAKQATRDVEARSSDALDYGDVVHRLCALVEAHVREEEGELFPTLRTTELNLDMLALALLDRRSTLMDVMGLYSDDEHGATARPPRSGDNDAQSASVRDL